jgi:large subunit ribosomal protein L22
MTEVTAQLKHLRIAPRKTRLLADLIRGKKATQALAILKFVPKKASEPVAKLLQSAVANAKHNYQLDEKNLCISKIFVDEGPTLKRWRPRSMGRAYEIKKRTSHVTLVLTEEKQEKQQAAKTKSVKKKKDIK